MRSPLVFNELLCQTGQPFWITAPGLLTVALVLLIYPGISARRTDSSYGA